MMRLVPLAAIALAAFSAPVAAYAADAAVAPVQSLSDALIGIMKAGKVAGVKGRAARIAPVVERSFDLPLMTRLTVGTAWTGFSPAQQTSLVAAFRRMTIGQYASNFDGWSGQSFAVDPQVEARGGDKLVRTTLKDPKGDDVAISYRLRQSAGSWKIIDVFYKNSISQIATRRSDFAAVVNKGGAPALVAHLDALAAKNGG
jgi:phospholipid transport system substrate-binding protein